MNKKEEEEKKKKEEDQNKRKRKKEMMKAVTNFAIRMHSKIQLYVCGFVTKRYSNY
jgi:hypothetical protein